MLNLILNLVIYKLILQFCSRSFDINIFNYFFEKKIKIRKIEIRKGFFSKETFRNWKQISEKTLRVNKMFHVSALEKVHKTDECELCKHESEKDYKKTRRLSDPDLIMKFSIRNQSN